MAKQTIHFSAVQTSVRFNNGTVLEISPFAGTATQFSSDGVSLRSASRSAEVDTSLDFERGLQELGAYEQETIYLDITAPSTLRSYTAAPANDRVVLRPAQGNPDEPSVRVVLYQDESGGLSWHFAEGALLTAEHRLALRSQGFTIDPVNQPVFIIPTRTIEALKAASDGLPRRPTGLRGPLTKIGRKIFKVIVMPIAAALLEKPVEAIVGTIERRHSREMVWSLNADTYHTKPDPNRPFKDWERLSGKRSLLIVHGILSSVEGMLSTLPAGAMGELCARYEDRVIGFNHVTVSNSPEDNARSFLEEAKRAVPGSNLEFDVLCHSRGGIVARALTERGRDLLSDTNCNFRKTFFVATPNNGSTLADPHRVVDMIDVFTNLLTNFPDGPVTYSIEVLLAIVKLLAYTAETALPGVRAMGRDGYIQQVLNQSGRGDPVPEKAYGAAAANYYPDPQADNAFFTGPFATAIVDRVFREGPVEVPNDLVVPQEGVHAENGHPAFPIRDPLLFGPSDRVWHSGFFRRPETMVAIRRHFQLPPAEPTEIVVMGRRRGGLRRLRAGGEAITFPTREREAAGLTTRFLPAPAPDEGPFPARRAPVITFSDSVNEGETHQLLIQLRDTEVAATSADTIEVRFETGARSVELGVGLSAPGFLINGPSYGSIPVFRTYNAEAEQLVFELKAVSPGGEPTVREIQVTFWLGMNCVGMAAHRVAVIPSGWKKPQPSAAAEIDQPAAKPVIITDASREDCDLAVIVRKDERNGSGTRYTLDLRSRIQNNAYEGKEAGFFDFGGGELSRYLDETILPLFESYPEDLLTLSDSAYDEALRKWNESFISNLGTLGKRLWKLLPEPFRNEYLRLLNTERLRSIIIYSQELLFPWELIVPSAMIDGRFREFDPLGVAHILGRWRPGIHLRPNPQSVRVQNFLIINPTYAKNPLPWSAEEVKRLKLIVPSAEELRPVDDATIKKLLKDRGNVQLVHFSGHGEFASNADLAGLILEDGAKLTAMALQATRFGNEGAPILYLNACSVGKAAPVAGTMGGFAANCIEGGFSGVIAPYWPVNDQSAAAFSNQLYTMVKQGRSIGEALQELRADHPKDPTFLAYSYIGDPWAKVIL